MPMTVSPGWSMAKYTASVRLRAGMRLHVDVLAAEQLHSAVTGEVFHHVHASRSRRNSGDPG